MTDNEKNSVKSSDSSDLEDVESQKPADYTAVPALKVPDDVRNLNPADVQLRDYIFYSQKESYPEQQKVDTLPAGITGIGHIEEWRRLHRAGEPEQIMDRFLERDTISKDPRPAVLLYPYIKSLNEIQIKIIMDFNQGLSAEKQISELRKINEVSVNEYFKERALKPREIGKKFEENPGLILTGGITNRVPDFRKLSVEQEIVHFANQILKQHEIKKYDFSLFNSDISFVGEKNTDFPRKMIDEGFYLPSELNIISQDEIVNTYRILVDALEQFIRDIARKQREKNKQSLLYNSLKQFDESYPVDEAKKQQKKRIVPFLDLIQQYFQRKDKNESVQMLLNMIRLIRKIMDDMSHEYDRNAEIQITKKIKEISEKIKGNSETEGKFSLLQIDPGQIFLPETFDNAERRQYNSDRVLTQLKENQEFYFCEKDGNYYFCHRPLLFRIEAEAKHKKKKVQTEVITMMIDDLVRSGADEKKYRKDLNAHNSTLYDEAVRLMASLEIQKEKEKKEKEEQDKRSSFNYMGGVIAGTLGAFSYPLFYVILMNGPFAFVLTLPVIVVLFFMGGKLAGARKKKRGVNLSDSESSAGGGIEKEGTAEKKINVQSEMEFLFPKNVKSIMGRVYPYNAFIKKLKSLPRLSRIESQSRLTLEMKKIENAISPQIVKIKISATKVPRQYSSAIVISRSDFQSKKIRDEIIRTYKNEAIRAKKNFKPEMYDYYQHIADEMESNSARYLGGRR